MKQLKNVNQLRDLYFLTTEAVHLSTSSKTAVDVKNHHIPFYPRWLNKIYATLSAYFWLPCDICGKKYGGHESYGSDYNTMTTVCPRCTLKHYNRTGSMNIEVGDKI